MEAIKEKNRILYYALLVIFFILAPALLVLSISPAIRSWLISSAQKIMQSSQQKDEVLKTEIKKIQNEIDQSSKKDDELKSKLEQISKDDDADWHKKMT